MTEIPALYPSSYESSRARFVQALESIKGRWSNARRIEFPLSIQNHLTIDWITADALERPEKVLVFTTGEHGIEGYVGSAMLQRFVEIFLHQLDPANTGLLLVHAINPWGMQHKRRTNPNNVDLNRNFVYDTTSLDPAFNPDYAKMDRSFNPPETIQSYSAARMKFTSNLVRHLQRMNWEQLRGIWLLGQYCQPKGIHYGSNKIEEESGVLMGIYRETFQTYDQILHLDMHTGYGPRYQMSLVDSLYEPRSSVELSQTFQYPLIVAANPDEFYAIHGDMIDYVYTLRDREFSGKRLYATSFEFGTFGASTEARVRTLRAMVLENQLYWYGAQDKQAEKLVRQEFEELFFPSEARWRAKAVADADQAFRGILRAEGYIRSES